MDFSEEPGLTDVNSLISSIEMIYGKNYFIEYNKTLGIFNIHLYFNEIVIKNSYNSQHNIKDLFVVIKFSLNRGSYELSSDLTGYRTFLTKNEAAVSYLHSHLSSCGNFCLGHGPLDKFMEKHGCSLILSNDNIDLFDEMLLMINQYVRWESIEGIPHRYMSSVVLNNKPEYEQVSNEFISNQDWVKKSENLNPSFLEQLFNNSTQIFLKENKYVLKFDTKYLVDNSFSTIEEEFLYLYKGSDGNLYVKNNNSGNRKNKALAGLNSQYNVVLPITLESGKIIDQFSTDENASDNKIVFKKILNKQFLSNVIKIFEQRIKQQI